MKETHLQDYSSRCPHTSSTDMEQREERQQPNHLRRQQSREGQNDRRAREAGYKCLSTRYVGPLGGPRKRRRGFQSSGGP